MEKNAETTTSALDGSWRYSLHTEFGVLDGSIELKYGARLSGAFVNMGKAHAIYDGVVDGSDVSFNATLRTSTAVMMLRVEARCEGDEMTGMFLTPLGDSPFTAHRAQERESTSDD